MHYAVRVTPAMIEAIIKATLPSGWTIGYRRDLGGRTWHREKHITVPRLRHGYRTLWVYFHEHGHALRMQDGRFKRSGRKIDGSSSYEEMCAEQHAMDMMRHFGFPISDVEAEKARLNVKRYLRQEIKRGWPVYEGVRRFVRGD